MIPFGGGRPGSFPKGVFFVEKQRSCPSCGPFGAVRFGKRKGVQRRRCRDCGAVFTAATGTPFSSAKLGRAKLEAVLSMTVRDCTVGDAADIAKVSTRTAYVWRMKAFTAAAERQKTAMLSGKACAFANLKLTHLSRFAI